MSIVASTLDKNENVPGDWSYSDDPRSRSYVLAHIADAEFDKLNRWRGQPPRKIDVEIGHMSDAKPLWFDESRLWSLFGLHVRDIREMEPCVEIRVDAESQAREIRLPVERWMDLLPCLPETIDMHVTSIVHKSPKPRRSRRYQPRGIA